MSAKNSTTLREWPWSYYLEPHEPDVLRILRGLTDEQYDAVLMLIGSFKRPLGKKVEKIPQ